MDEAKRAGEGRNGELGKDDASLLRSSDPSLLDMRHVGISKISLRVLSRWHSLWRDRE